MDAKVISEIKNRYLAGENMAILSLMLIQQGLNSNEVIALQQMWDAEKANGGKPLF